jgi:hypothetical protein
MKQFTDMKDVHIGALIEQKVREKMSISRFSMELNCDRKTVYKIFKRDSIDFKELEQISEILNYDFILALHPKGKDGNIAQNTNRQ